MAQEEISLEDLIMFQDAEANDIPVVVPVDDPDPAPDPAPDPEPSPDPDPDPDPSPDPDPTPDPEPTSDPEPDPDPTPDPAPDPDPEPGSTSNYNQYYNHLNETGFLNLPEDFKFDGTPEKLEEAFKLSDERKQEDIKNALVNAIPPNATPLFRHLAAGGSMQSYLEVAGPLDLDKMDVTNVSHQRKIVEQHFRETTNYDDKKIDRLVNRLVDLDALNESAQEALPELKELETERANAVALESEQAKLNAAQAASEARNSLSAAIKDSSFIHAKRKPKVTAFMFNEVTRGDSTTTDYNRVLGEISSNPEHIIQLADILMNYDGSKGFDMTQYEKRGKTKSNSSFRKSLESNIDPKTVLSGKGSVVPDDKVDWEALLAQAEK